MNQRFGKHHVIPIEKGGSDCDKNTRLVEIQKLGAFRILFKGMQPKEIFRKLLYFWFKFDHIQLNEYISHKIEEIENIIEDKIFDNGV